MIADAWNSLPLVLRDPVALAVPAFVLLLVVEWVAAAKLEHGTYLSKDARASLATGLVSIATSAAWKALGLVAYTLIYDHVAPWHLPADAWYTWVILLLGVDLLFYWYHRIAHRTRIVWATHQAHHSSEYFNFATALRQKWNNSGELIMWIPLPLIGIPPWMVFVGFSVNLVYQFWVHTERIDRMPRWFEFVFNTPSHHRVHHGSDPQYLDKNYAGILVIWDRLFDTYAEETSSPRYGLTKPVETYNIVRLQTREYEAIARDVRSANGLRAKLGYVFGPPGWAPGGVSVRGDRGELVRESLVDRTIRP
ncbi:C-5 sterol desaturase [Rhodococcoides trifolii]|uniref:C-5 sterol desaturase n=1 Tax=Rhodococcoides trifolii TaxID=908250 RepID=A0A917G1I4_9NOCA|nr:sterol desaturase family protein [Rhodococcus trifolii]GGG18289.1 C-5 sterol desaturase [Rhodococcus trifolii]